MARLYWLMGRYLGEPVPQNGRIKLSALDKPGFGVELNPAYVDVAITRWQQMTSGEARLEGSGETFAQVATQRVKED